MASRVLSTSLLGRILGVRLNYNNANNWQILTPKEVAQVTSTYNMQGLRILQGMKHNTGYTTWLVQDDAAKNYVGSQKWIVFDPKRNLITGEHKFSKDALAAAQQHSKDNPMSGVGQVGNKFEFDMIDMNFIPSGTQIAMGNRTEFVSSDGSWILRYNTTGGVSNRWNLYDGKHNFLIKSGIDLRDVDKKGGVNKQELTSAIQDANRKQHCPSLTQKRTA